MSDLPSSDQTVLNALRYAREAAEKLGLHDAVQAFADVEQTAIDFPKFTSRALKFLEEEGHLDSLYEDEDQNITHLRTGTRIAFALDHIISEDVFDDALFWGSGCDALEVSDKFRQYIHNLYTDEVLSLLKPSIEEDHRVSLDEPGFLDYLHTPTRRTLNQPT